MKCRVSPKNTTCVGQDTDDKDKIVCVDTDICLGLGRDLIYRNGCLTVEYNNLVEDGWYSEFQIVNGCVVSARTSELPVYTPAPCAPEPTDCNGGGGGTGSISLSPNACNLLTYSGNDLLARLHVEAGANVILSGCGTQNSPLNIAAATGSTGVVIGVGTALTLSVTGSGSSTNPYIISSQPSGVTPGNYLGFDVDTFGRITSFDPQGAGNAITGVANGIGTKATIAAGILTIDIVDTGVQTGSYVCGGWILTVDSRGQLIAVARAITMTSATYQFGRYRVHINEFGSIDSIEEVAISSDVVYDTFAKFFGMEGAGDTERAMTITMEASGYLFVEYEGYLGSISVSAVGLRQNTSSFYLLVDGAMIPMVAAVVATSSGDVVGLKGHTQNAVSAGTHTISIATTNTSDAAIMTSNMAYLKATMADRGA